ncbi:MAG: menaquinone biosynthesis protein [Bacteroidota bacterium]
MKIALVSYINTRPFMDGLSAAFSPQEVQLDLRPPAECARVLAEGQCDMALIPVGALDQFSDIRLLPDYCIGASGSVESVYIFSQQPIETLDTLYLDRHSRSSNGLARILLRHHWGIAPEIRMPAEKNVSLIHGHTGGVVIGDYAIRVREQFAYRYDLAEAWQALTGLPFAFAVWAYHPDRVDPRMLTPLQTAMGVGVDNALKSASRWADFYKIPRDYALHYLTNCIDFRFDAPKHQALELYLGALRSLTEVNYATLPPF